MPLMICMIISDIEERIVREKAEIKPLQSAGCYLYHFTLKLEKKK